MQLEKKREVRDSYDLLGGRRYDARYRLEQEAKYDEILRHLHPSTDDVVLDAGCGTGLLLARLRSHAVGVDLSHGLLSMACSRLKEEETANLICADADQLPLRDRVFDKVFAVTLIQNTPEPERALTELGRVAKPPSEVVVTALKKAFTPHGFERLLRASGLSMRRLVADGGLRDWIAFTTIYPRWKVNKNNIYQ